MSPHPKNRLALVRCDATKAMGGGHVGRCLALADGLSQAGWNVEFSVGPDAERVFPRLASSEYVIHRVGTGDVGDANSLKACLRPGQRSDLTIIDHYNLDATFDSACRSFSDRILVLDDATGRTHDCDLLLDAAVRDVGSYNRLVAAGARILCGFEFALVRREFIAARPDALSRRDGRPVRNILLSFGATDPKNATSMVLDAIYGTWPNITVTVALASEAPHFEDVRRRCIGGAHRLVSDLQDMAPLLTEADLAIGAAGVSAYERAVLGVPSLMLVLADNQRGIADAMVGAGAALYAGDIGDCPQDKINNLIADLVSNSEQRISIASAAASTIDGRGAMRVAEAIQ